VTNIPFEDTRKLVTVSGEELTGPILIGIDLIFIDATPRILVQVMNL
jgi:hypothetical protein